MAGGSRNEAALRGQTAASLHGLHQNPSREGDGDWASQSGAGFPPRCHHTRSVAS